MLLIHIVCHSVYVLLTNVCTFLGGVTLDFELYVFTNSKRAPIKNFIAMLQQNVSWLEINMIYGENSFTKNNDKWELWYWRRGQRYNQISVVIKYIVIWKYFSPKICILYISIYR